MGDSVVFLLTIVGIMFTTTSVLAFAEIEDDEEIVFFEHYTRPTFGIDHQNSESVVENGFRINENYFDITDNHHTPFPAQLIKVGKTNWFEATIFAEKGLKVQEFLFGIPIVGEAHLAELGVEVWYDLEGQIEDVKVVQKTNVIDETTLVATHAKTRCNLLDTEYNCDTTNISMVFLEPLKDEVMAIKAIDFKNRYQITYLNEGIVVDGEQINPLPTKMIPSAIKYQGLIPVTQVEKYSDYWMTEDGRMFEKNDYDSFTQVNYSFDRFQDKGEPLTRLHSGFGGIIESEEKRALQIFDSNTIASELPESVSLDVSIGERISNDLKAAMLWQEMHARKILEDSTIQARYH